MAWRIEDSVVRGEIDNRIRGRVTGKIWLAGQSEPMELRLTGDPWRDLAGRFLEFVNPDPKLGDRGSLSRRQQGPVGDITASRKVQVPDIPLEKISEYCAAKRPWPWHWSNSLYLEWFSETDGRVVVESANFELKLIGEPTWEMSAEEDETQRQATSEAITGFLEQLGENSAIEDDPADYQVKHRAVENAEAWASRPLTEAEAERLQEASDRLADRIHARLTREGERVDLERIMNEEIERLKRERGEADSSAPEQIALRAAWVEEMNRAGRESIGLPGVDETPNCPHPLATKSQKLAVQMMSDTRNRGWLREAEGEEHPVAALVDSVVKSGGRLAGALNGRAWPPSLERCASIIVRLLKARAYLDDAVLAMESCQEQKLIPPDWLGVVLVEIVDLARAIDILISELRTRLQRRTE